ncbi:fumarylacetoacetate hydrolase [Phlyctema vagabunda]|uniref:Fumarylacetoacetase n=1 Tax=Phlyctema vagabunda TaxID=108571 RepID=A0ABR4PKX6_9HELO
MDKVAMCGLATGDLLGTSTISGDAVDDKGKKKELGCLYETTQDGLEVVTLADGFEMKYPENGDEIILTCWCEGVHENMTLGFGDCRGTLLPAFENEVSMGFN